MPATIFDQPAEALTSKLAKGLSYIAEQSGNNWILPTGTNAVSGDFISVDGIMGQATASIVGGTDAIVEGTNWNQCPSGALNALNSNINNSFASGEITSGTLAEKASTELTIDFGKTLKSVPVVVANIYQNVSDNSIYILQVSNITTTGAIINIRCNRASIQLSSNRKVAWVAVCI